MSLLNYSERKTLTDAVIAAREAGADCMDIRKLKAAELLALTGRSWLVVDKAHWPKTISDNSAYDFLGDGLLVCSERFADRVIPLLWSQRKKDEPPKYPRRPEAFFYGGIGLYNGS